MATGWGREVRRALQNIATQNAAGKTFTTPFASLSTALLADDGQNNAEPAAGTGGYAAQAVSWTAPPLPALDASALAQNSGALTWGPSSAAYSTGATPLQSMGIWNHVTTRTEAAFLGRATIAVPQAVAAAGITLTCAIGGLTMGMISA
jgi:hypothetical protein